MECGTYYYGSACAVNCKAADTDSGGHFTCHPTTGAKICRVGQLESCFTNKNVNCLVIVMFIFDRINEVFYVYAKLIIMSTLFLFQGGRGHIAKFRIVIIQTVSA